MKKHLLIWFSLSLFFCGPVFSAVSAHSKLFAAAQARYGDELRIEVWNDRGNGAVYEPGTPVTIYFKANYDCYLTLYNIDTEGRIHLLYPFGPHQSNFVSGGIIYSIPDGWRGFQIVANGPTGIDYIAAVATYEPHPVPTWLKFHPSIRHTRYWGNGYFEKITYDPYMAMDDIAGRIIEPCPGYVHYVQDFCVFYVGAPVYYPRYLCYNCHSHRRYRPYRDVCVVYEIWADVDWDITPVIIRKKHPRGFWRYRKRIKPYRAYSPKDRLIRYPKRSQKVVNRKGKNNIAFRRISDTKNPVMSFKKPKKSLKLTPGEKRAFERDIQPKKPKPGKTYPVQPGRSYKRIDDWNESHKRSKPEKYNPPMNRKKEPEKSVRSFKKPDKHLKPVPSKSKSMKKKEVMKRSIPKKTKSESIERSRKATKSRDNPKKSTKSRSHTTSKKKSKAVR